MFEGYVDWEVMAEKGIDVPHNGVVGVVIVFCIRVDESHWSAVYSTSGVKIRDDLGSGMPTLVTCAGGSFCVLEASQAKDLFIENNAYLSKGNYSTGMVGHIYYHEAAGSGPKEHISRFIKGHYYRYRGPSFGEGIRDGLPILCVVDIKDLNGDGRFDRYGVGFSWRIEDTSLFEEVFPVKEFEQGKYYMFYGGSGGVFYDSKMLQVGDHKPRKCCYSIKGGNALFEGLNESVSTTFTYAWRLDHNIFFEAPAPSKGNKRFETSFKFEKGKYYRWVSGNHTGYGTSMRKMVDGKCRLCTCSGGGSITSFEGIEGGVWNWRLDENVFEEAPAIGLMTDTHFGRALDREANNEKPATPISFEGFKRTKPVIHVKHNKPLPKVRTNK